MNDSKRPRRECTRNKTLINSDVPFASNARKGNAINANIRSSTTKKVCTHACQMSKSTCPKKTDKKKFDNPMQKSNSKFKLLEKKFAESSSNLNVCKAKINSLQKLNRELRQKNRAHMQSIQEEVRLRDTMCGYLSLRSSKLDQLKARNVALELAGRENIRRRKKQQQIIQFKDDIINNLRYEIHLLKVSESPKTENRSVQLLDLPEEVLHMIFRYVPNDEIVWSVGHVCQQLMEYVLRYVWVIEDSFSKYLQRGINSILNSSKSGMVDLVDLTTDQPGQDSFRKFPLGCKISQLINTDIVAKAIFHFVYTEDYRTHQSILKKIEISSKKDLSKKVLLVKTRDISLFDVLVRITSQWNQLESIVLRKPGGFPELVKAPEKVRYILENCPHLKLLDISTENGIGLSIEGWNFVSSLCSTLTHISFYGGCITDSNIETITRNNHRLESIDIERCKLITDHGIRSILTNCAALQSLRLSIDACSDVSEYAFEINPKSLDLKSFILQGMTYGGIKANRYSRSQYDGSRSLIKMLCNFKSLKHLDLSRTDCLKAGDIYDILEKCTALEYLELENAKLDDLCVAKIPDFSKLTTLNLSGNSISYMGIKRIVEHLKQLRYLKFSNGTIWDKWNDQEIDTIYDMFPRLTKF